MHNGTPSMDELTVVIVNWNTLDLLKRCVRTLLAMGLDSSHIVVVDNASQDGSADWLRKESATGLVVQLLDRNKGFAGGNNVGISFVRTKYVMLLNSDAFPEPGSLEYLVSVMEANPRIGVAGPQLIDENGKLQRSSGYIHSPTLAMWDAFGIPGATSALHSFLWRYISLRQPSLDVGYVIGAAMLLRKEVIDEVGGLDEGYFFYSEDADICDRLRRQGYRVVLVPSVRVVHLHGSSSSKKEPAKAAAMLKESQKRFVTQRFGDVGWTKYALWKQRGFAWRLAICRAVTLLTKKNEQKCIQYALLRASFEVHQKESRLLKHG